MVVVPRQKPPQERNSVDGATKLEGAEARNVHPSSRSLGLVEYQGAGTWSFGRTGNVINCTLCQCSFYRELVSCIEICGKREKIGVY